MENRFFRTTQKIDPFSGTTSRKLRMPKLEPIAKKQLKELLTTTVRLHEQEKELLKQLKEIQENTKSVETKIDRLRVSLAIFKKEEDRLLN